MALPSFLFQTVHGESLLPFANDGLSSAVLKRLLRFSQPVLAERLEAILRSKYSGAG